MKVQRQFVVSEATQRDTVGRNRVEVLDEDTFQMNNLIKCQIKFSSDNFDKLTHVLYVSDADHMYLIKYRIMEINPYTGSAFEALQEKIRSMNLDHDDVVNSDVFRAMIRRATKDYTKDITAEAYQEVFENAKAKLLNMKSWLADETRVNPEVSENTNELVEENDKAVDDNDN